MRIVRVNHQNDVFYGVLEGETVVRLCGTPYAELIRDGRVYPLSDVRLLAPVEPTKIVCVGKN